MSDSLPLRARLLGDFDSPHTSANKGYREGGEEEISNFVVILVAFLCALICVLGLTIISRCTWFHRITALFVDSPPPPPPINSAANKGLKKKVLNALPKQTCTQEDVAKFFECAICLSEFAVGEEIRVLPGCGHGYHVMCIDTWLKKHSSCPSCRLILVGASSKACNKCGEIPEGSTSRMDTPYVFLP